MSSVTDSELVAVVLATFDDLSNVELGRLWGLSNGYVSQLRAGRRAKLSTLTREAARNLLRSRGVDLADPAWRERERLGATRDEAPSGGFSADYWRGARDMARRLLRAARDLEADAALHADAGAPALRRVPATPIVRASMKRGPERRSGDT